MDETRELFPGGAPAPGRPVAPGAPLPQFPGFRTLARLGEGSFGAVYRARDRILGRDVAIKVLLPHLRDDARARQRLLSEARALARVQHPNVLSIYRVLTHRDEIALVTEYVRGASLDRVLAERGPLATDETIRIGIEVTRALEAVHSAGIVHRDLKAANLIRRTDGGIVLTDFGLGLSLAPRLHQIDDRITGSPLFMAPEQAAGEAADPRTDIYALGVVLYHLLTGEYPVTRQTIPELLLAIRGGQILPLGCLRADLPAALVAAIDRSLSLRPQDRFQTAAAFGEALRRSRRVLAARTPA